LDSALGLVELHSEAKRKSRLGLKVHWLAAPVPGTKSSGKRPIDSGWQKRPYLAPDDVPPPPFPGANLGIQTGRVDGAPLPLICVDLDSEAAIKWADAHGVVSPMASITGGGQHRFFRYPDGATKIANKCRFTLEDGTKLEIDVRGDGGNVVVAPSVHPSGHVYKEVVPWDQINPEDIPVYDPSWLDGRKHSATIGRPRSSAPTADDIPPLPELSGEPPTERPGVLPEQFSARLYDACARGGGGSAAIEALRRMSKGENYAPDGERNNTLFQAVRLLAEWFPDATDAQLEDFARDSVIKTGSKDPVEELQNYRDVLRRAREKFGARDNLIMRLTAAGVETTTALVDAGDIRARLILTFGTGTHLVMRADGSYSNAVWKQEKLHQHIGHENLLGWAERAGLAQFTYETDKGVKRVTWPVLAERHGYPVNEWRGSFDATYSRVEGETFVESIAPKRNDLSPMFDARIDTWLRALGGEVADRLLDWCACLPKLSRPLPALVLVGARKAGKNLLAEGAARLWRAGTPTPFEAVQADFNEALQRCPLLFADEQLPKDARGRVAIDEQLRQLVTARSHVINRKYQPVVTVDGCVRIVIATNQESFEFRGMTEEAKNALAERLLFVRVGSAAREYLESLGGSRATEAWVNGDGIARHVLWLNENRTLTYPGSRLMVEGNGRELIDNAQNSGGVGADLCTWLCGYLTDPGASNIGNGAKGVIYGNGELWVSTLAWVGGEEAWSRFVKHTRAELPSVVQLGRALSGLSGDVRKQLPVPLPLPKGFPTRSQYHKIDVRQLLAWADRYGYDAASIAVNVGVKGETEHGNADSMGVDAVLPSRDDARDVDRGAPGTPATVLASASPRDAVEPREAQASGLGVDGPSAGIRVAPAPVEPAHRAARKLSDLLSAQVDGHEVNDSGTVDPALAGLPLVYGACAPHEVWKTDEQRNESIRAARAITGTVDATNPDPSKWSANVRVLPENAAPVADEPPKRKTHRKPCSKKHFEATGQCICPPSKAKQKKTRPPEVRGETYYTPESAPWLDEVAKALPATEADAVVTFAPYLSAAMAQSNVAPAVYARVVHAYRVYRFALRQGDAPARALEQAREAYADQGMRPLYVETSLERAPEGAEEDEG
jgi:hypothetical protein